MVFPSVPLYLDPPSWNQQQAQPPIDGSTVPPRPNSMSERARLAKIPQPEPALKCPRCDSTNTKFCYFNNYSLSQPRHFCKACRRYWTRGGALRNVPVGGGCRRNKRSSKPSTKTSAAVSAGAVAPPQMPFLHPMMDYGSSPSIALGLHGMQTMEPVHHYQLQLPPLPQPVPGMYSFDNQDAGKSTAVKMEETRGLDMARQYLGIQRNDQFWGSSIGASSSAGGGTGGGGWLTDLSGFNASSTGNLL